jgi:hypothetical protein
MGKMKTLRENMFEREDEIETLLNVAKEKRPAFYDMVSATPSYKTCKSLLRGITDDDELILMVTQHMSDKK